MELRNKKTGEIGELQITEKHYGVIVGNGTASCGVELYSSLAELNSEWEDVPEEPKRFWYIGESGRIYMDSNWGDEIRLLMKQIGNYFETKEEAEKAVEKLKAWKRLKDKGFRFRWINKESGNIKYAFYTDLSINHGEINRFDYEDLDLLFGGEE